MPFVHLSLEEKHKYVAAKKDIHPCKSLKLTVYYKAALKTT